MILALVQNHVTLRKQGAHYVGRCPKCGGTEATTRFVVNIAKDFCQCYSCSFNADPIRFLREIEGKTCPEAHRTLGLDCDNPHCPVWEKCSKGKGERPTSQKSTMTTPAPAVDRPTPGFNASAATTPPDLWQAKAAKLVNRAHQALLDTPEQLAYLSSRGLPLAAVIKYRLGYVPEDFYRDRSSWGLPEELWPDGRPKKLFIPQGILIPWFIDGLIHRIRIRKQALRNAKDGRYYWLPGSGNDIICLNPAAQAHVIVESDLDGLLIDWQAGDLVGTIPLGSCSTHPKAKALTLLEKSLCIMVALDFDKPRWDEEKQQWIAPGAKSSLWWAQKFPRAYKRWPVPDGKDPGEAFAAGVDLPAWVVLGLPPALQIRATVPDDVPAEEPIQVGIPAVAEPLYKTITAADGRQFILTDDPGTYRTMTDAGKICFTSAEMRLVARAVDTPQQAARILDIKTTFPGIRITETTDLREIA
ncbi:MAG TPA: hypothetical protein DCZ63_14855 [Geobacter sp.]|nr:hypothetical protein [Geobacter sp.]